MMADAFMAAPVVIEPLGIDVNRAANMLGVGRTRIYELVNSGQLLCKYEGTKRLIDVASLRAYYQSLPTERPA